MSITFRQVGPFAGEVDGLDIRRMTRAGDGPTVARAA